jgi:hypothetical protein
MPHRRSIWLARNAHAYTNEPHRLAVERMRRFPGPPIPTATPAQQHLEFELFRHIGYCGITDGHGWMPGDGPFSIDWLSPLPESLDIGVVEEALPEIVDALMPTLMPGDEPRGVRGLRPRLTPAGVELRRIGLPGLLRLRGVSRRSWERAIEISLKVWDDPSEVELLWRTHPDEMHPEEKALAHRSDAGYAPAGRGRTRLAPATSLLLRRHMLFRGPSPTSEITLWMNPGSIQLEWYGGPDHLTVAHALLDPVFGVPGKVNDPCTCRDPQADRSRCWSVEMEFDSSPGAVVNLRRGRDRWDDSSVQYSERARTRRADALRRYQGAVRVVG